MTEYQLLLIVGRLIQVSLVLLPHIKVTENDLSTEEIKYCSAVVSLTRAARYHISHRLITVSSFFSHLSYYHVPLFVNNADCSRFKFASSSFLHSSYILYGFYSGELGHCSF